MKDLSRITISIESFNNASITKVCFFSLNEEDRVIELSISEPNGGPDYQFTHLNKAEARQLADFLNEYADQMEDDEND